MSVDNLAPDARKEAMTQSVVRRSPQVWLTPITALTFVVVGLTGVLMLFDVRLGPLKALHEWIGVAFVVAGVIHLVLNGRRFLSYFRKPAAAVALAVAVVFCVPFLGASSGMHEGPHGKGWGGPPPGDRGMMVFGPSAQSLDADKDEKVTPEEFDAAWRTALGTQFTQIDKDGNGVLSKEELASASRTPGPPH